MRKRLLWFAPLILLAGLLFIALGGFIVQQLWNWLLPPLFGWPQLGSWQALGLLALCGILFGGVGRGGGPRSRVRRRIAERCERMSPEERERVRQAIRARWGFGPSASEGRE
jgi:hypothetical protein